VDKTIPGKLPQRIISREAARGFSSYGNQIGLAAGLIAEVYHPGYVAKRLEAGFVVGAAPAENVRREKPQPGDIVLLIGGETGRDGCGGATGSSKAHDTDSMATSGAEVQKGSPMTERKIQKLFRNPDCSRLIKRCNDFGAGGVSVAIGELADGLLIDLDAVPKKYEGLSGTELAISESQERMAVVIRPEDLGKMTEFCAAENVRVTQVALVTGTNRMIMNFGGREIVNLKRSFLSSNGVRQNASVLISDLVPHYMDESSAEAAPFLAKADYAGALAAELKRLNVCSNKGLSEMFDSTIGAASVFMPFGGSKQLCPAIAMAAKLPAFPLGTDTATVAAWGFDPYLMSQSPFVGAQYSLLLSVAKLCAAGAPFDGIYLSLQEYFKKLLREPARWGEPVSAMLGALSAQLKLELGAIGGKDSMSGSYMDLDVPPTLISFAIAAAKASTLIDNVLYEGARVHRIAIPRSASGCPDYDFFRKLMEKLSANIAAAKVNFCTVVEAGGTAAAIARSCLGNGLGFGFEYCKEDLFHPRLADILLAGEISAFKEFSPEFIGTAGGESFIFGDRSLLVKTAEEAYLATLSPLFPLSAEDGKGAVNVDFHRKTFLAYGGEKFASPRVLITVFPDTNGEYDMAQKFLDAGAEVEIFVFKNLDAAAIKASLAGLAAGIRASQIIAIPGGFSGGDEPDGSANFIATAFRLPELADAVSELLEKRQGLVLGIGSGFQALLKLGLLPFGKITPPAGDSATLYYNHIGRHVSSLCPVRVASADSPWLSNVKPGDIFMTAVSHGQGRLITGDGILSSLKSSGRICTQYVDESGIPTGKMPFNPNGSICAIEGLISPCGRILGKMGHIERATEGLFKNVPGEKIMDIFSAGLRFFR
jgi:phosphoribosylformylglycinamidine synthase